MQMATFILRGASAIAQYTKPRQRQRFATYPLSFIDLMGLHR